jgi:hypothetical protein
MTQTNNDSALTRRRFVGVTGLTATSVLLTSHTRAAQTLPESIVSGTTPKDSLLQTLAPWLRQAARRAGLQVKARSLLVVIQQGFCLVSAPIAGLAHVDPVQMAQGGMQTSFFFMDAPDAGVSAGFYCSNIVAREITLGRIDVVAEYYQEHNLIDQRPGFAEVTSLFVPSDVEPSVVEGFTLDPDPAAAKRFK